MNWLQWLQFSLALAAQITPILQAIEAAIGMGKGAEKKALATGLVMSSIPADQQAGVAPIVSSQIDTTVAALNATGVFKKSPQ